MLLQLRLYEYLKIELFAEKLKGACSGGMWTDGIETTGA